MTMNVAEVRCLRDNYAYLVWREGSGDALVIDPSEAAPVEAACAARGLTLVAILNTHHHWDHVGGNEALLASQADLPVYAHASDKREDRVHGQTHEVKHGVAFEVAGFTVDPLHVPGHTMGAVTYCIEDAAFTGDTLFVGGCGRIFEGTPAMMNTSLNGVLAKLPPATRVFCGHEYTTSNLTFAAHVEPDNARIAAKLAWSKAQDEAGKPTIPSTIEDELATNPFMRCTEPTVIARYGGDTPAEVLGAVRRAKNEF